MTSRLDPQSLAYRSDPCDHGEPVDHCAECWMDRQALLAPVERAAKGRPCWVCDGTGEVPKYDASKLAPHDIDAGLHRHTIECPEAQCIGGTYYPKEG